MKITEHFGALLIILVGSMNLVAVPLVVPEGFENIPGNVIFFFDSRIDANPERYQLLIPESAFSEYSGFVAINSISIRPSRSETAPFQFTIPGYNITASTTSLDPNDLVVDFDDNLSFNQKIVRSGPLTLSSNVTGSPQFDFDMRIDFDSPFLYNPASGNLLFDVLSEPFIGTAPVAAAYVDTTDSRLDGFGVVQSVDLAGNPTPTVLENASWLSVLDITPDNTVAYFVTGSPSELFQTVDVPSDPFLLTFDYRFETLTGELSILLAGELLGTIGAAGTMLSDFMTAEFLVDGTILGQSGVTLQFLLDGPSNSSLFLDNVHFPGLLNGEFEDQLVNWNTASSGQGSVQARQVSSLTTVPEPITTTLSLMGLSALSMATRRRGA